MTVLSVYYYCIFYETSNIAEFEFTRQGGLTKIPDILKIIFHRF
jgi:hypothetical protein